MRGDYLYYGVTVLSLIGHVICSDFVESEDAVDLFGPNDLVEPLYSEKKLKQFFDNFFPYYLPSRKNATGQCKEDLSKIFVTLIELFSNGSYFMEDRWSLKLIDSWGKHEDGIMQGNNDAFGFFEECLAVQGEKNHAIETQYCLITYKIRTTDTTARSRPRFEAKLGLPIILNRYATCMPASCSKYDLVSSINEVLSTSGLEVKNAYCQVKDPDPDFDGSEIFGIIFFTLLLFLLLVASVFDIVTEKLKKQGLRAKYAMLIAFSVPTNLSKLFTLDTNPSGDTFTSVHGIRVLSFLWVMLAHVYSMSYRVSSNKYAIYKDSQIFWEQVLFNGYHSVDTFYCLGGFFLARSVWKNLDKNGQFPAVMYYLHRIIRLTPPVAIYCCFLATISRFFVYGPGSPIFDDKYVTGCRHSWWADVVYGTNFFYKYKVDTPEKEGEAASCCGQCWYIATDMQIFIFMPVIILPVYYLRQKGVYWLSFWTFLSVLIPALIIGLNELPGSLFLADGFSPRGIEFFDKVYMMPWCRANAYIAGTVAAFICRKCPRRPKLSKEIVISGWVLAMILSFVLVYGLYPYNQIKFPNKVYDMSQAVNIIYGSLNGLLWGAVVSWIVLACYWGYGGYINTVLSHPLFHPISRLTYCLYLVHLQILIMMYYSTVRPLYFSHTTMVTEAMGLFLYSIGGALILNLLSESPTVRLEKILFKR